MMTSKPDAQAKERCGLTFASVFRSCAVLTSREATAAKSLGRQPKDCVPKSGMSREAAADSWPKFAAAASRLNAISAGFLGLTPEAIRDRRFATQEMRNF